MERNTRIPKNLLKVVVRLLLNVWDIQKREAGVKEKRKI
jgi:hypothetical protein